MRNQKTRKVYWKNGIWVHFNVYWKLNLWEIISNNKN